MDQQESRTAQVAIAVTPSEKEAIHLAAKVRGKDVSNYLREKSFAEVLEEGRRLMEKLREFADNPDEPKGRRRPKEAVSAA